MSPGTPDWSWRQLLSGVAALVHFVCPSSAMRVTREKSLEWCGPCCLTVSSVRVGLRRGLERCHAPAPPPRAPRAQEPLHVQCVCEESQSISLKQLGPVHTAGCVVTRGSTRREQPVALRDGQQRATPRTLRAAPTCSFPLAPAMPQVPAEQGPLPVDGQGSLMLGPLLSESL